MTQDRVVAREYPGVARRFDPRVPLQEAVSSSRAERFARVSRALASLSDGELAEPLALATPVGVGIGGPVATMEVDGVRVSRRRRNDHGRSRLAPPIVAVVGFGTDAALRVLAMVALTLASQGARADQEFLDQRDPADVQAQQAALGRPPRRWSR